MSLYIQHYGVLGMHWGQLKARDKSYRENMGRLEKASVNKSDKAKFKYAKQNLTGRLGSVAGPIVVQYAIRQAMATALLGQKFDTSPRGLLKIGSGLAKSTAISFALSETASKSASMKYDDKGKLRSGKKGSKNGLTREDAALITAQTAISMYPYAKLMATMKLHSVLDKRRENKERFDKWGANILPEKVDNVVWQSPDLQTAVIDTGAPKGWH